MDQPNNENILVADFISESESEIAKDFNSSAFTKKFAKGEFISMEGDSCGYMALVKSGDVRVFKIGETGKEITLYHLERGESCILTASCILSGKSFPAVSVAETETELILIPESIFRLWIEKYEPWRKHVFEMLTKRLTLVIAVVEEVAFKRMDSRIAEYILHNAAEGKVLKTHNEIAGELGTSREVVSRILKDFEKEGMIEILRGTINILSAAKLKAKE